MRTLLAALLMPVLAACATAAGSGGGAPVLVNRTAAPLVYSAFGLSQAGLVDPVPQVGPAEAPERRVAAGAETVIGIPDYEGEGVVLFLYLFPSADHAGPVPLSRTLQVTPEQLRASGNRIVIDS